MSTTLLATAMVAANAVSQAQLTIPFERYQLDNGLEVILSHDDRLPLAAVNIWYHTSPIHEPPGRSGFAHLFEHLMFQGSRNVKNGQHLAMLESIGATNMNATTGYDRTNYFQTVPSNQLEKVLWLESDRMGFLLDTLTDKELENQRDVVKNERRQRVENVPYGKSRETMTHSLFPQSHPYWGQVIGSMEDLDAATLDDVKDFFIKNYAPSNATMVIAGDFDVAATKAMVEKYFGSLPSRPKPKMPDIAQPKITSEIRKVVGETVQLGRVQMAWHSPAFFAPGDAESDLLASVLGQGKSSRLYKELVYKQQLAQTVTAYQSSSQLGSTFLIQATAKPGVALKDLEAGIEAVVAELQQRPPTTTELERARNAFLTGTFSALQRIGGFGGKADVLNRYNHYVGTPDYLAQDLARYEAITSDQIKSWATELLNPQHRVVVWTKPSEAKTPQS